MIETPGLLVDVVAVGNVPHTRHLLWYRYLGGATASALCLPYPCHHIARDAGSLWNDCHTGQPSPWIQMGRGAEKTVEDRRYYIYLMVKRKVVLKINTALIQTHSAPGLALQLGVAGIKLMVSPRGCGKRVSCRTQSTASRRAPPSPRTSASCENRRRTPRSTHIAL
jgi:hypothetical protein